MTWAEFKTDVEAKGATDNMEIWYIDVTFPAAQDLCSRPADCGWVRG